MGFLKALKRDVSATALVAGLIVVLVGYSSGLVIVLEAASSAQLDADRTASWVWAMSIGSGVCGFALSAFTRTPIVVAWSTPGAALLIGSLAGFSFEEAVGAFILASLAATVFGITGWFGWFMKRVPEPVLQALLAGVLLPFIINAVASFDDAPLLAAGIAIAFFIGKRFFDRYAVLVALVVGFVIAALTGSFAGLQVGFAPTVPVLTFPSFTLSAAVTIALPLFLVTMASQNAPGLAILRFEGYQPNDRLLIGGISTVSTLLALFGNHAINLAAITAAIAAGPEANRVRERRYIAGLSAGAIYVVLGTMSTQVTALFQALPGPAVTTLAAVALLGTTLAALRGAVNADVPTGVAAVATLVVTMSGVVLLGAGSAFWGLVVGVVLSYALSSAALPRQSR